MASRRVLVPRPRINEEISSASYVASASPQENDGREEEHDPNELEWEAALRRHAGTFRQFDSIIPTERVQWAKDHLTEEMNRHELNRKTFEEDREKWAREKEEMMARHLLELRKEVVRAWMRIEEQEWQDARKTWKEEATELEHKFKEELNRIKAIPPKPHLDSLPTPMMATPSYPQVWGRRY